MKNEWTKEDWLAEVRSIANQVRLTQSYQDKFNELPDWAKKRLLEGDWDERRTEDSHPEGRAD